MHRHFCLDMSFPRFAWNTLLFSLAGLIPLLALFVALTPGFGDMLADGGPALGLFLRQVATNGLPVVFVVNYVAFFLFAWMNSADGPAPAAILLIDLPVRIVVFVALHAIIYVASARWFGSFGGSPATALQVVGPTLARSVFFENISGVYLYATMVGAIPLYASAIARAPRLAALARRIPGGWGDAVLAFAIFGVFVFGLTVLAAAIVQLQGGP